MRHKGEGGFVIVWASLLITVLLGFTGFAVDLGSWYLNIQRTQRASDAAALAGDAYMPANYTVNDAQGNNARQVAYQTLLSNGVLQADADKALASTNCATPYCISAVPGEPTQLQVKVQTTVKNNFLRMIGVADSMKFARDAIADHSPSLHITSFSNVLGGPEPDDGTGVRWGPATTTNTNYWMQMGGRQTSKVEGDRFNSRNCARNPGYDRPDLCAGNVNTEFDAAADGYLFLVEVNPTPLMTGTAYLELQAYDAQMTLNYDPAICPTGGAIKSPTCPGDDTYGVNTTGPLHDLRFNYYPDDVSRTPITSCRRFYPRMGPVTPQWEAVCPNRMVVDMSKKSTFYVRAYTSTEQGTNHFMLRAGLFNTASGGTVNAAASRVAVQMSGDQHMPINNQIDSHVSMGRPFSSFSIADIHTEWAGRTIHFQFWDLGDAQDSNGNDSGGSLFLSGSPYVQTKLANNCTYTRPGGNTYNETNFTAATLGATRCGFTVTRQDFNGKLVNLNWDVPDDYSCEAPTNCRLVVQMDMNGSVTDDTTTSVREPGAPIHLVE